MPLTQPDTRTSRGASSSTSSSSRDFQSRNSPSLGSTRNEHTTNGNASSGHAKIPGLSASSNVRNSSAPYLRPRGFCHTTGSWPACAALCPGFASLPGCCPGCCSSCCCCCADSASPTADEISGGGSAWRNTLSRKRETPRTCCANNRGSDVLPQSSLIENAN